MTAPELADKALALLKEETLTAFQADHEYVHEHFEEWLADYPEHWVVVKGRARLLVSKNMDEVRAAIDEHGTDAVVALLRPRGLHRVLTLHR